MSYEKQNFKDGSTLFAAQLEKMEDGIINKSYNDLADKPFYKEYGDWEEVYSSSDLAFNEDEGFFSITENVPSLTVGQSYKVNWNGTEYTSTYIDMSTSIADSTVYALGNVGAIGAGSDTGEPFCILFAFGDMMAYPFDSSTVLNLTISGQEVIYHRIDKEFLPIRIVLSLDSSTGTISSNVTPEVALEMLKNDLTTDVFFVNYSDDALKLASHCLYTTYNTENDYVYMYFSNVVTDNGVTLTNVRVKCDGSEFTIAT